MKSKAELIERAEARDKEWEQGALEAERNGDSQLCWLYMAWRAENRRFLKKMRSDEEGPV